jgi:hypothetical protein
MPSLHDTQDRVMGALLRRPDGLPAAPLLRSRQGLAAERRLQVYRHNLETSLGAALAAVYPVVARLVGDDCFRALARRYVARFPSRSGNLHEFGAALPGFLAAEPALAALPYLGDVAALEWASHEVYHEADPVAFDFAALAAVPGDAQPAVRLKLQHATRFVVSAYPVLAIWQANQPGAADAQTTLSLDAGGVRLLVARSGFEVEYRLLGAAEERWLRRLAEGGDLAAATEAALALDAGFDLGATLGRHLALGAFRAFSIGPEDER